MTAFEINGETVRRSRITGKFCKHSHSTLFFGSAGKFKLYLIWTFPTFVYIVVFLLLYRRLSSALFSAAAVAQRWFESENILFHIIRNFGAAQNGLPCGC